MEHRAMAAPAVRQHTGGLATQAVTGAGQITDWERVYDLPRMCPKSHQPEPGSRLVVRYSPADTVLEVMALDRVMRRLIGEMVGGFQGVDGLPPVRDMEGAIGNLAQAAAAALGVPVEAMADLVIFGRPLRVTATATGGAA